MKKKERLDAEMRYEYDCCRYSYPVLVQELDLDLHICPEFLEFCLLPVKLVLCLSVARLVHVGLGRGRVELEVGAVGVVFGSEGREMLRFSIDILTGFKHLRY